MRLSDVIGRTVKLRRSGREYMGLRPFAKERSPSFFVNDEKGFFHDFSSGKRTCAPPSPSNAAAAWASAWRRRPSGSRRSCAGRRGEAARGYLDRRGLPQSEHGRFRLGFVPMDRSGLKDHLIAKGAGPADFVEAGLLIAPKDGSAPYDRFRDRIIFPSPMAGAGGQLRRPGARSSGAGQIAERAAKPALLQGPRGLRPARGATAPACFRERRGRHGRWWLSRVPWT